MLNDYPSCQEKLNIKLPVTDKNSKTDCVRNSRPCKIHDFCRMGWVVKGQGCFQNRPEFSGIVGHAPATGRLPNPLWYRSHECFAFFRWSKSSFHEDQKFAPSLLWLRSPQATTLRQHVRGEQDHGSLLFVDFTHLHVWMMYFHSFLLNAAKLCLLTLSFQSTSFWTVAKRMTPQQNTTRRLAARRKLLESWGTTITIWHLQNDFSSSKFQTWMASEVIRKHVSAIYNHNHMPDAMKRNCLTVAYHAFRVVIQSPKQTQKPEQQASTQIQWNGRPASQLFQEQHGQWSPAARATLKPRRRRWSSPRRRLRGRFGNPWIPSESWDVLSPGVYFRHCFWSPFLGLNKAPPPPPPKLRDVSKKRTKVGSYRLPFADCPPSSQSFLKARPHLIWFQQGRKNTW